MPGLKTLAAVDVLLILTVVIHAIFLSTSTQAQVSHATSRTQLRRRHSKSAGGKLFSNYIPTYSWEQKEYVKAHNELREEAKVPPLQWHPDLANSSHMWALELRSTCDYRSHSKSNNYGENIFWSLYKEFTPTDVVKKWHSEIVHFDHDTNLCRCQPETDKCECGHYLNVIWKTTQWVGCSNAVYCNEAKGVIVVCQYDPMGNYKGINPLNPLTQLVTPALQLAKNTLKHARGGGRHNAQHHSTFSIGVSHAQNSTSININVSHDAQHSASINTIVSHDAQHSTSINTSVSHEDQHSSSFNNSSTTFNDDGRQTTSINNGSSAAAAHVSPPPPPQPQMNKDSGNAQEDPTSINSNSNSSNTIAHVPPPTPNSTTDHVQTPPLPPVNNDKGVAQDPTAINSAAHVPTPPSSPINSGGGGNAQHSTSINSGSPVPPPASVVPPTPPMQSMPKSHN